MCHDRTRVRAVRCIRSAGAPRNLPREGKQGNHTSYYLLVLGVTSGTAARKIYSMTLKTRRPEFGTKETLNLDPWRSPCTPPHYI